jgi:hypothetical protein
MGDSVFVTVLLVVFSEGPEKATNEGEWESQISFENFDPRLNPQP